MEKKKLLTISWSVVLILAAMPFMAACQPAPPPAPAPLKPIELSYATMVPPTHFAYGETMDWVTQVETRTQGRVKITVYPSATLVEPVNTYDGIVKGIADIGWGVTAYTPDLFQLIELAEVPVGIPSADIGTRIVWELYKKYRPEQQANVKVIAFFACAPVLLFTKLPVHNLEDLQGMEVKISGGTEDKMMAALGATPTFIDMGECYEALQKGIVKGVVTSADTLEGYKLADLLSYIIKPGFETGLFFVVMNIDKWNSLPPDIQKIIDEVSEEWIESTGKAWDKGSEDGINYGVGQGMEVITLSPEEAARWQERIAFIAEQQAAALEAKGLPARKFLDDVLRLKEEYSK